ncbi:polysaccharide biosynthesis protein GtrA [Paenibacillus flagellatus]|uniref:Polysaccharide biosynthesis protein GtrA n=1 Tax=Paenibacillus flagellatus TaxID=2211139 RepID=A0A2V5KD45_9BACL|nr:polysaccharide biosynthesis protein GtrA [Paenibacillus flagellatus]
MDRSFLRFLLVGVFNTLVGLSVIALLLHVAGAGYWASTFIGNGVGALVSYALNKRFTFRSDASVGRSLWRYLTVTVVCYGLSYGVGLLGGKLLSALLPAFPESRIHDAAALLGTGLYTIANYAGHKYFTFRTVRTVSGQAGESSS